MANFEIKQSNEGDDSNPIENRNEALVVPENITDTPLEEKSPEEKLVTDDFRLATEGKSFEEGRDALFELLNKIGEIKGKSGYYTAEQLKDRINKVFSGELNVGSITRFGDLRGVVGTLFVKKLEETRIEKLKEEIVGEPSNVAQREERISPQELFKGEDEAHERELLELKSRERPSLLERFKKLF